MRWFLDTEFDEDGRTIELISIALVREDGEFLYCVSNEFDPAHCNEWVQANVLPHLLPRLVWKSRAQIRDEVFSAMTADGGKPEIWGYFSDYDWVVFCQLFGRMVDLPKGFPMWCRDLKQLMEQHGVTKDQLPPQTGTAHDALEDARWIREAYLHITGAK
jgi:hypothetical protein